MQKQKCMLITVFADDRKKLAHNKIISIWLITVVMFTETVVLT
jgi:hypothetical protein